MIKKHTPTSAQIPVTVVIPMRNSATTLPDCLRSISTQRYPIDEILVVDNVSSDNSREIVASFAKSCPIPVKILRQTVDRGVAASYNRGTKEAKSPFVVFMTSDVSLPTSFELERLVAPLLRDPAIGATFSTSVLPQFIWDKYNFWEKYFAARMVENYSSLMVLKFDCVRREAFLSVGGFDEVNFGGDKAIGGEDADLTNRLKHHWRIERTDARSYHLHYVAQDYTLAHMMQSKKMYARSTGRWLRKSPLQDIRATLIFCIKPAIAVIGLTPGLGWLLLLLFAIAYTPKMFTAPVTRNDPRIVLVPILNIFFVYYETWWIIQGFFSYRPPRQAASYTLTEKVRHA